jgi:hypothetical protein
MIKVRRLQKYYTSKTSISILNAQTEKNSAGVFPDLFFFAPEQNREGG